VAEDVPLDGVAPAPAPVEPEAEVEVDEEFLLAGFVAGFVAGLVEGWVDPLVDVVVDGRLATGACAPAPATTGVDGTVGESEDSDGAAPNAAPVSGPARPATVSPHPARTHSSAHRARLLLIGGFGRG
jgi:hypothetical protein